MREPMASLGVSALLSMQWTVTAPPIRSAWAHGLKWSMQSSVLQSLQPRAEGTRIVVLSSGRSPQMQSSVLQSL
eukprot:CAMPEP_0197880626 /NCGR_PEP_ID=MMETSP1439-20131203/8372_1 /TAXON_ID=66791 /ORGANISM="Gonyaulax spinifera, Strain CCMP409" /LENGTH=73 /DNA_ID=CAMNT_0043500189 /DNA_START=173 /DNA_END=391 /DNA_ORIENTATION=-